MRNPYLKFLYLAMLPYTIPRVILSQVFTRQDRNLLNDGKKELSGEKACAIFRNDLMIDDIKVATKRLQITVNDLFMTALSMATKRYLVSKGDTETQFINICIPVSIRWTPYKTWDDVKLENKFAPMPLDLPLISNPKTALTEICKLTNGMKSQMSMVYATYIISLWGALLMPIAFQKWLSNIMTLPITLIFSNTPGLLTGTKWKG